MHRSSLSLDFSHHSFDFISSRQAVPPVPTDSSATVPIGTLANLPDLVTRLGHDGWRFMEDYGLGPASFSRPLQPVPIAVCGELIYRATVLTGNDDLPVLLGSMAQMENLGPLRMLVASCGNLREALDALLRFRRLWYSPIRAALHEQNGTAAVSIDIASRFLGMQEIRTTYLTALAHNIATLAGTHWKLKQIAYTRPSPATASAYRRVLGVTPMFAQARDELYFDARLLDREREKAGPGAEMNEWLRTQVGAMAQSRGLDFRTQVSDLIEALIMGGGCNAQKMAELLGMSTVTLYRRLRLHGVTFEQLLDAERERMAKAMLQRPSMLIRDIADALGYSTASNFTRAFVRWTDQSPEQWRRSLSLAR
jgi:AraC-like DNA-binding protein